MWVVADSSNGYFLDVDVYVGRPSDGVTTEHGLGERVVLQLTEQYSHKITGCSVTIFFLHLRSSMNFFHKGCTHVVQCALTAVAILQPSRGCHLHVESTNLSNEEH